MSETDELTEKLNLLCIGEGLIKQKIFAESKNINNEKY